MAGGARKRKGIISDINVTPLVDISLVLLIAFMLTATLITNAVIEVELPQASSGNTPDPTTLAITMDREGKVFLNGRETTAAELEQAVRDAVAADATTQAIIAADKNTTHGRVVWAIDLVNTLGVQSFAINVDPGAIQPPTEPEEHGSP